MFSILNKGFVGFLKHRYTQIERFMHKPVETQNRVLSNLINSAKNTEWGKLHHYHSIAHKNDFKERVPVQDYDQIRPWIDRMLAGEQNLLWHSQIHWFAKSSGTTSDKSKFIPVSQEALRGCHQKAGLDVMALFSHNKPKTRVFEGKGLILGGSHSISSYNQGARYGDLSAVLLQNFPKMVEFMRTPKLQVALMDNWEEKLDVMARTTMLQNVTSISGVPSWSLLLVNKILELSGKENILEVWPNLELFNHGGVSFVPYKEQFKKLIPSDSMYYLETYNASEGFFGAQDQAHSKDMLLMLDYGVYYEFIPMDEFNKPNPKVLSLDEVDMHTNYALVISTNGGLWRYIIGDTIRFTSLAPFRITISGRTRNFINAFGEEIIVDNTDRALDKACQATGAQISEYTAAPVFLNGNGSAAHEYLIDFAKLPTCIDEFTDILDKELQQLNSDYEAKRSNDLMLKKPILKIVPRDAFVGWLKSKGKLGGQHKVPRLYNNRKYVDEILEFVSHLSN